MIRRLYVHNFRCLTNFTLPVSSQSSVLLIGNNGSGKTTVGLALEILQKIAAEAKEWQVQHALLKRLKDIVHKQRITHSEIAKRAGTSRSR
ncbi:MAG: AAA family ATPase [Acidobacteriia bacterium]|nr:AAA family ATPase [Terriglobia bacterium]